MSEQFEYEADQPRSPRVYAPRGKDVWTHRGPERKKPLTLREIHDISKRVALAGAMFSTSLLNGAGLITGKDYLKELLPEVLLDPIEFHRKNQADVAACRIKTPNGMMLVKVGRVVPEEVVGTAKRTAPKTIFLKYTDGNWVECTFEPATQAGETTVAKKRHY